MSGEEWGVNADPNPEPGTFLVEWQSGADWKGDTKKKQVNVVINLEGVTVTRVQTKKKDPKVGAWDWYHIKSWDVAPNHFAFKIVGADSSVTNYMFDTKQAKTIAATFKDQVNAIMARKRKQKEAKQSGESSLEGDGVPDWDPDALPVLATRTKIMKVEVKFQTNGMLAPPPKSSLARGQAGSAPNRAAGGTIGGGAAPAPVTENVEVLETDNPMSSLLELFAESAAPPAGAPTRAPAPDMGGTVGTGGDLFGAGPALVSQTPPQPMDLLSQMSMGPGAPMTSGAPPTVPAGQQPMAALQPALDPAMQPRTMAEIQAAAFAANPQLGAGPLAQNPFAMQQPFVQQQHAAPMNPFMTPAQLQAGGQNPFLAAPAPVRQQQAAPKPPNPFDSLI